MRFCEIASFFISLNNITFLSNDTKTQRYFSYTHESFNCVTIAVMYTECIGFFRSKLKPINSFGFFVRVIQACLVLVSIDEPLRIESK